MHIFFSTSERELRFFALFVFLLKQMRFDNFWLKRNLTSATITLIHYSIDKNDFYWVMYYLFCSTTWWPLENYIYKESKLPLISCLRFYFYIFSSHILPTFYQPWLLRAYIHTHILLCQKKPMHIFYLSSGIYSYTLTALIRLVSVSFTATSVHSLSVKRSDV